MVAAVGAWGDFRRGEEAGDEPRGQSHVFGWIPSLQALRAGSAAKIDVVFSVGRVRAVG